MQHVRDVIHGLIGVTDQESQIIDSSEFQRLRSIKQLALTNYLYPGANHSRFEHLFGTMHVVDRIAKESKRLQIDEDQRLLLRLAALLHDVGHGPFSHVAESLLAAYTAPGLIRGLDSEEIHEQITVDVIAGDTEISSHLSTDQRNQIVTIITKKFHPDYLRQLISGPLDADKLDYLIRDCHYTGVKYGQFDIHKIIESYIVVQTGRDQFLGITDEAVHAIEQFVLARHYMHQQVYQHRVRTITDAMIVEGLKRAVEGGADSIRELFSYERSSTFLKRYLSLTDEDLMLRALNCGIEQARYYFERLRQRRLFKEICHMPLKDSSIAFRRRTEKLDRNEPLKDRIKEAIANHLGLDTWKIVVSYKSQQSPASKAAGVHLDDNTILVKSADEAEPRPLHELPQTILRSSGEGPIARVCLFVPIDECESVRDRYLAGKESQVALSKELAQHVEEAVVSA